MELMKYLLCATKPPPSEARRLTIPGETLAQQVSMYKAEGNVDPCNIFGRAG
jgi:hypothetical protein